MADLHITNGDSAASLISKSEVPGDVLSWRDPMHHGPFPADLDLDALAEVRGRYFSAPDADANDTIRDFRLRDEHLRGAAKYARVVLWFEHDLLDQLQILQLLDWFAQTEVEIASLELICINTFPGIESFRGLGQLDAQQLASLVGRATEVTPAQLKLAVKGWAAFRDPDPRELEAFIATDLSPLPFLRAALLRHLQEYPWADTGLTRTENQILNLVAQGTQDPGELFVQNMGLETELFIGDWPTYRCVGELCEAEVPLIESATSEPYWYPPIARGGRDAFRAQRLTLTSAGAAVLSGADHAFDKLQRDNWLGGVHFQTGERLWTWDSSVAELTLRLP